MELFKRLSLVFAPTVLSVCGGLLIFSQLGSTAFAADTMPEIDPGAICGAMSLLMGSIMVLTGKCVRK